MNLAKSRRKPSNNDDSMIPLINIVFLLLIFFMVAGQISQSDAVQVQPPLSQANSLIEPDQVTVLIDMDGQIYLENELISSSRLTQQLQSLRSEDEGSIPAPVLIKADGEMPMRVVQSVLSDIKDAGITRISIATSLRSGGEPS